MDPFRRLRGALTAALVSILLIAASSRAPAATPETVVVTAADTAQHWTSPILLGGSGLDRSMCVEDVSCDTVHIELQPGDYTGKRILVSIDWTILSNDWDLFVFRDYIDGPVVGSSHDFVPQNREAVPITIDAVLTQPRVYAAHVVGAEFVAPEQVRGTVRVEPAMQQRTATRIYDGAFQFSASTTMSAPGSSRDCEPSLRVDTRGNCYVGGIRGVPGGVDLWRFDLDPASAAFDPEMRNPFYLGQPDAFADNDTTGGRDGGGDIDIATSFPASAQVPVVTIVSLAAANISSAVSTDRGNNFALSPAVANVPADDRQWIEADGPNNVYLMYRAPIPGDALLVQKSTDHGANYGTAVLVSPTGTTPGYIDVDHTDGTVYVAHMSGVALLVSRSTDGGATWTSHTADNSTSHGNLFDTVKVGDDGAVYVCWSDGQSVYLAHSSDHAATWSPAVKVSGDESPIAIFPWLEAGSAGRVAVVWYGSNVASNTNATDWRCWAAVTTDARAASPTFYLSEVGGHVIHASNLSLSGLTIPVVDEEPNRNLCDYFQVAIDPLGACVVAFTDDHNDFDGQTYTARQLGGPSLYASANGGTGVLPPFTPTPPPAQDPALPEVPDFLHDATQNGLQVIPADSPFDILSIDYDCAVVNGEPALVARMKVSDLTAPPAGMYWRVNFAANAPGPVADRGDQFYLRAAMDSPGATLTYGTAVRDTSGSLAYTERGAAAGELDAANQEVVMRVPLSALNAYVTHGPPVQAGSVLVGLRGQTGTMQQSTTRDETRGGGSYKVCGSLVAVRDPSTPIEMALGQPSPNPGRGSVTVPITLSHPAWVDVGVFDPSGRRVRTLIAGTLPAGSRRVFWDARTDAGHHAPSGVYYLRLTAGGVMRSRRTVLVH
ncbi:MAG TPA: FlgD immunoglobulin-like domain containing protein [Candidatus Eisenbacteria bacterium]